MVRRRLRFGLQSGDRLMERPRRGQTTCTRRPARRLLLIVLRPFFVRIRARNPILRARFTLLIR